jgi:polysaccharide biosynthesis protein PslG
MPSFRMGAARLWNSRTRWSNLEPRRGGFEWATLDRLVAGTERAGLEATYVIGGTPAWAAPQAPVMPFLEKPRATGPDNLTYWDRFVRKLVDRYGDRIRAYELWDLADEPRLSRETPERLVEMTRRASRIIKSADKDTYVICPGMTVQPGKPKAMRMFRRFAELGGYSHCDGASIKQSQHNASDPPEGMLVSLLDMARLMRESGVGIPLWNTGPAYDDAHQAGLDEEKAANHAARFYLTGLYGRTFGMRRMYFYSWGTATLPITLQDVDGPPTRAARYVERLQDWLAGAHIRSCGHGAASGLPATVWKCEFVVGGRWATIMWTHAGSAHVAAPPGVHHVRHLDGTSVRLRPGGEITVTERPAFITPWPPG